MYAGPSQSTVAQTSEQPVRTPRYWLLAAIVVTSILAGCASRTARAPVTDMSDAEARASAAAAGGGTYTVKRGDTLYKIAQAHGMEVGALMSANNISNPNQLQPGQILRVGGSVASASPSPAQPGTVATPTPVPVPVPVEPPSEPPPRAADATAVTWGWPASGPIIQTFNANTKGIDISGELGDPVLAAADGTVRYAGNGVRGMGDLILLEHSNGFITAYAHNQTLFVKTGQKVRKGAKIAAIGQSDTTSPRLHFEIRRRGAPMNPLSYLPHR